VVLHCKTFITSLVKINHMKIVCPDCKSTAEMSDNFTFVKCSKCSLDITYGEYVKYVAYKDKRYRNILSDYKL
jgi:ribosomal protein L37AE/L43A